MRQPLWIINSLLLLLFLIMLIFMLFSRVALPGRETISPAVRPVVTHVTPEKAKINVATIWEYDLFDTFEQKPPEEIAPLGPGPVPEPPQPSAPLIPAITKPTFLPPLNVTLKGTINDTDDRKNRALIANNDTKQEAAYKVGDVIGDAQLMRIFSNKVIFVRSNGQQEVLYLREKDAKTDPTYVAVGGWSDVVKETAPNNYLVDPALFIERVKTLAQFIEMLDLTTVYKQGTSIGIRVGNIEKDSLGTAMGLKAGDIILKVNNLPADTKIQRAKIYQTIMHIKPADKITLSLNRDGQEFTLTIALQEMKKTSIIKDEAQLTSKVEAISPEAMQEKEAKILQEKFKFAPTLKEIRERERKNIMERGKRTKPSIVE